MIARAFSAIGNFTMKMFYIIVTILIITIIVIGLIRFSSALGFLILFQGLTNRIVATTGMSVWVAYLCALPILLAFLYVLGMAFSVKSKPRRKWGRILIMTLLITAMIFSAFIRREDLVSPDGPSKCYVETPNRTYRVVPCPWKFDELGFPVKKITPEIARQIWIQKNGPPKVRRVTPSRDLTIVDTNGNPQLWCYQRQDGRIEMFDHPGYHPQFANVRLIPCTGEIMSKVFQYLDEGQSEMLITDKANDDSASATYPGTGELKKLRDILSENEGR